MVFKASKNKVELEIRYHHNEVFIYPLSKYGFNDSILRALARSERLLANVHLKRVSTANPSQELLRYFEYRGWTLTPLRSIPGMSFETELLSNY
jgi:hypothetical protein